jgi:8-oxo-dGTP pyrophosphatase MutT (NUDIX family)
VEGDLIRAAGVMLVSPAGRVLLLRRSGAGDHAGEWCFPGGTLEGDETALEAALRELNEECGGRVKSADPVELMRRVAEGVEYTTFVAMVEAEATPELDEEHDGWAWVEVERTLAVQAPYPTPVPNVIGQTTDA